MTVKELIQNVEDLKVHLNEVSVYDLDVHTSMDLYYTIAKKFNIVIKELMRFEGVVSDEVIKQNEKLVYLLGEGLNSEVVNKINNMVLDGTMDNIINTKLFNNLDSQIKEAAKQTDLDLQIKRIDSFLSLEQGSTTGDAELIDGRIGADGVLDNNIGNSIRRQYKKNKYEIDDLKKELKGLYTCKRQVLDNYGFTPNTYYSNNQLNVATANGYYTQKVLNIPSGTYYYFGVANAFTWIVNRNTGEIKRGSTDLGLTDKYKGVVTIDYDYDLYYTTSGMPDNNKLWQNFPIDDDIQGGFTYGCTDYKMFYDDKEVNIIIGKSTDAKYETIGNAISLITDSSSNKIYNLLLEDGTYEENNLDLPDYVNLIGRSGIKENVIIKGELPDTSEDSDITNKSTINLKYTNTLENLTITAKNLRYAIHSESNGNIKNWTQIVKNCHIEHFGNDAVIEYRKANNLDYDNIWKQCYAWGEGVSSGAYAYFENTKFKSATSQSWYIHEAVNMDKPYYHKFKNCVFESNGAYSLQISEVRNSTQVNNIEIESCEIYGKGIYIQGSYPINISINDCGDVPFMLESDRFDIKHFPHFKGRINRLKYVGSTTINGGELLRYDTNANQVTTVDSNTDINLIIGYAISTVDEDGYVYICTSPYYPDSTGYDGNYVGISSSSKPTNYSSGTKIGISLSSTIKLFLA